MSVARAAVLVEVAGFGFHRGGQFADAIEAEVFGQPHGRMADEPFDILAADQGDVVAEALAVHFDEAAAVAILFDLHFQEDLGGAGVGFLEGVGDGAVGAAVLFFRGDRQGEDFPFGQIFERFGHEWAPQEKFRFPPQEE